MTPRVAILAATPTALCATPRCITAGRPKLVTACALRRPPLFCQCFVFRGCDTRSRLPTRKAPTCCRCERHQRNSTPRARRSCITWSNACAATASRCLLRVKKQVVDVNARHGLVRLHRRKEHLFDGRPGARSDLHRSGSGKETKMPCVQSEGSACLSAPLLAAAIDAAVACRCLLAPFTAAGARRERLQQVELVALQLAPQRHAGPMPRICAASVWLPPAS